MKERPIIMSAESVRAILAGTKTQTRRAIRTKPPVTLVHRGTDQSGLSWWSEPSGWIRCPYGLPGDRLWVRETWAPWPGGGTGWSVYMANAPELPWTPARWRSPIHMPRWASRITLELVDVRVQRLQEISGDDIAAEMGWLPCDRGPDCSCAPDMFRPIWDRLNGKRAPWESNPWVWALTFRRV